MRVLGAGNWEDTFDLSTGEFDAHRPVIASGNAPQAWLFWDEFNGTYYTVQGRPVVPTGRFSGADFSAGRAQFDSHCLDDLTGTRCRLATKSGRDGRSRP